MFFSKTSIGLDIDDRSIEVIRIKKSGSKIKVLNLARVEIEANTLERGQIKNAEKLSENLKTVLEKAKLRSVLKYKKIKLEKTLSVIFSLPESQVYTCWLNIPQENLNNKETFSKFMLGKALANIPLEKEDLIYSFKINKIENGQAEVFLIGTSAKLLEDWSQFFKKIKINVRFFDLEVLAIARALKLEAQDFPVAVVDFGGASLSVLIINEKGLIASHAKELGGDFLTSNIAKALKINFSQAEEIKLKFGLDFPEEKIFTPLSRALESVSNEIKTFLDFFTNKNQQEIKKIILTGGSSRLKGLINYLEANLEKKVVFSALTQVIDKLPQEYLEAGGLALRGLEKNNQDLFFQPPTKNNSLIKDIHNFFNRFKFKKEKSQTDSFLNKEEKLKFQKKLLFLMFVFGLIGLILAFAYRYYNNDQNKTQNIIIKTIKTDQVLPENKTINLQEESVLTQVIASSTQDNQIISTSTLEQLDQDYLDNLATSTSDLIQESIKMVKIKPTEFGWLNVRQGPAVTYPIITKIYPNETYPLLTEQEKWYKIEISGKASGWINSYYAEIK